MTTLATVNGQDFTERNAQRFLHLHGYFPPTLSWSIAENLQAGMSEFNAAVEYMQQKNGLLVDGRVGNFTAQAMQMPTCGSIGMRGSRSGSCRWGMGCGGDERKDRTDITIHFDPTGVQGISEDQAQEMARVAVEKWDTPSGFRFVWIDDPREANIRARMKKLSRLILGLAWLPCGVACGDQLELYMQQTAQWGYGDRGSFHEVFGHEGGHTVGMEHEDRKPSIMTSAALGVYTSPTEYDIGLMIDIYGEPLFTPEPPPIDPIPPIAPPPAGGKEDNGILTFYDSDGNVSSKWDVTERIIRQV